MFTPSLRRKNMAMASMRAYYHCTKNSYKAISTILYLIFPTTETLGQTPDLMLVQKAKLLQ